MRRNNNFQTTPHHHHRQNLPIIPTKVPLSILRESIIMNVPNFVYSLVEAEHLRMFCKHLGLGEASINVTVSTAQKCYIRFLSTEWRYEMFRTFEPDYLLL
jgi:hypothetical protein